MFCRFLYFEIFAIWHTFYTHSSFQSARAALQALKSHMWQVATIWDSIVSCLRKIPWSSGMAPSLDIFAPMLGSPYQKNQ